MAAVNYIPTQTEREAFVWLQGRMIELLMRHDTAQFDKLFGKQVADPATLAEDKLEPYRRLAVLYYLRSELFDHILPRIKNRLSSVAPRQLKIEAMPTRGRVDWGRTAVANWREKPGEVPLEVYTRQRRRHFATPENLLAVVTLLEYRNLAQDILRHEAALQAVRHPFNRIVEDCQREMSFLQFAGLVKECQAIVAGYGEITPKELERQTQANLLPGSNSAYSDLLHWRQQLEKLRLRDRTVSKLSTPMLGADPKRDNYLYQTWIFYELCDLLQREGRLIKANYPKMVLTFKWVDGDGLECKYKLQHDRTIRGIANQNLTYWEGEVPGVRPDFYIWPIRPKVQSKHQIIKDDNDEIIWHEPGYVLDAKYYRPHKKLTNSDGHSNHSGPVKRMLADLQLTGERYGALLFAFENEVDNTPGEEVQSSGPYPRRIVPRPELAQYVQPDIQINKWLVAPRLGEAIDDILRQILNDVHTKLKQVIEVRCHGVFLDSFSANATGKTSLLSALLQRDGTAFSSSDKLDEMLLCPKPHVAPWRVDLVNFNTDCHKEENEAVTFKGSSLCNIREQTGLHSPRRLTTPQELKAALAHDISDEIVVEAATQNALATAKRYVALINPDLDYYRAELLVRLDIGDVFDKTLLLTADQKDTLVLGFFLYRQIESVKSQNYAGAALLFTGTLEQVARETIYKCTPSLHLDDHRKTLKAIGHYNNSSKIITSIMPAHWNENISPTRPYKFIEWVNKCWSLGEIRNDAAHTAHVDKNNFDKLMKLYFGGSSSGYGMLNGFLLAWKP